MASLHMLLGRSYVLILLNGDLLIIFNRFLTFWRLCGIMALVIFESNTSHDTAFTRNQQAAQAAKLDLPAGLHVTGCR